MQRRCRGGAAGAQRGRSAGLHLAEVSADVVGWVDGAAEEHGRRVHPALVRDECDELTYLERVEGGG